MKNKIYTLVLITVVFLNVNSLFAQQDPQFTHYMYNPSTINPAFAGYRNSLSATLIHRSQWIGVKGAPSSQALSIQSPLNNEKIALGANLYNDVVGPINEMAFNVDFAYTIMTEKSNINFGIKGGVQSYSFDPNKLSIQDQTDTNFTTIKNQFSPQIGVGVMFETSKLYLGVSVPNIIETRHENSSLTEFKTSTERRNYYASAGYIFDLSQTIKLKTSAISKIVAGAPLQLDLSANFLFNEKITVGTAYRMDAAVSLMAGFQLTKELLIGAAYDYDTTEFTKTNSGSAEFILRYELSTNTVKRILNPRIF
jgi:type IX secretion system PorP/SprF family membrane protein